MVLPFLAAAAPFAPLIGGAISAIGNLFAPKPKAQKITNSIDLDKLRDDAEAAGFNPLTIIRGGGLAGYGVQDIPASPDMRLSNAFQAFGSGVAQWQFDPYGEAKSIMELRRMDAEIASYASRGAVPPNQSFDVPTARGAGAGGKPYTFFGLDVQPSPWFSPAEVVEAQHGDVASSVWGMLTIPADIAYNVGNWWQKLPTAAEAMPHKFKKEVLDITVRGGAN